MKGAMRQRDWPVAVAAIFAAPVQASRNLEIFPTIPLHVTNTNHTITGAASPSGYAVDSAVSCTIFEPPSIPEISIREHLLLQSQPSTSLHLRPCRGRRLPPLPDDWRQGLVERIRERHSYYRPEEGHSASWISEHRVPVPPCGVRLLTA